MRTVGPGSQHGQFHIGSLGGHSYSYSEVLCFFFKIVPRHDTSDFVLFDLANVKSNVS